MADNIKSKMGFCRCGNGGKWQTLKVSEFAYVIGDGTPATKIEKYWNGSIPWLTPKDLSNHEGRYISKGELYPISLTLYTLHLPSSLPRVSEQSGDPDPRDRREAEFPIIGTFLLSAKHCGQCFLDKPQSQT